MNGKTEKLVSALRELIKDASPQTANLLPGSFAILNTKQALEYGVKEGDILYGCQIFISRNLPISDSEDKGSE